MDGISVFQENLKTIARTGKSIIDEKLFANSEKAYRTNTAYESLMNNGVSSSMTETNSILGVASEQDILSLPSQLSMSQCPTSLYNFPRFPHPLSIHDDGVGLSLASSRMHRPTPSARRTRHFVPNDCKDEYYWQKRRKNNEAARKSREKRRTIDSVLEKKVLLLAHENKVLRDELRALKLKYGEIPPDTPSAHLEKFDELQMSMVKQEQLLRESLGNQIVGFSGSSLNPSLGSPLFPHTAISLPRLNVVLESDKTSSEAASSAKLVLSNLASGTLILSPVNAGGASLLLSSPPGSNDAPSSSSQASASDAVQRKSSVEAIQALASLYTGCITSPSKSMDDNPSTAGGVSRSSSVDKQSEVGEMKNTQHLPHKLRFKNSHRESLD